MGNPTKTNAWQRLEQHAETGSHVIDKNISRIVELSGFRFDYSKQRVTDETLQGLIALAKEQNLEEMREKLFAGEKLNTSENRSVQHMACRAETPIVKNPKTEEAVEFSQSILKRMEDFSESVRNGSLTGFSGKKITDVVNIGVGGSDLGIRLVCRALSHLKDKIKVHFVSNIDASDLHTKLSKLSPETTLFLVASKTFTTDETISNAKAAKEWFTKASSDISKHFVALSTNLEETGKFGITEEMVFPFEGWVGGRFSLWSAIGLSIMISIGAKNFHELLQGAHEMDKHFYEAPLEKNIPILMALLGIWERNFMDSRSMAILPYAEDLSLLPAYLQQLDMESNGKSIDKNGKKIDYKTAPIIFGQAGTNGQHAFYQALHQGTDTIPADFILIKDLPHHLKDHQDKLLANGIAQTQALAFGNGDDFSGNKPLSLFLLDELNPHFLGMLIAAYEHKIFTQGILWNLNSFDQPGVELGKKLARNILDNADSAESYAFLFKK